MARRTKKERALLPETDNPSAVEKETTILSMEGAHLQPENGNDSGRVEQEPKTETDSGFVFMSRKGKQTVRVGVRRSTRLQGMVTPASITDIDQVIQEITLSGSEEEEEQEKEQSPAYEETGQNGSTMGNKNLEDKIDYLLWLMEKQQDKFSPNGSSSPSYSGYKRLYIDSQMKIEELLEENRQLSMRLEKAQGALGVYEKGPRHFLEVLEKVKDIVNTSSPKRRKA